MGYQWYKGRLLDDEEYNSEVSADNQFVFMIIGFLIPTVALWVLAETFVENKGWIGAIIGGVFGVVFNTFLARIVEWIFRIARWILIIGFIALILYLIFSPEKN